MLVAVSPYHLTTREPAAMAALLLADSVVTLVPAGTRRRAEAAAERSEHYLDFVMSWEWSVPLWREGVIAGEVAGSDASADVRHIHASIAGDERLAPLRSLMRPDVMETDEAYLDAVARDLLKGGPDPAITVPLAAGLDRFAMRHAAAVARSHPTSVVQIAESRMGARAFALAVPVLLQCSADRLLEARELLSEELIEVRAALDAMRSGAADTERLETAASAYCRAFDGARADLMETEFDEPRVIDGVVAITGTLLPVDAVLASSLAALGAAGLGRGAAAAGGEGALDTPRVLSLVFKVMGRAGAPRR